MANFHPWGGNEETSRQRQARLERGREREAALDREYADGYAAGVAAGVADATEQANRALAAAGIDAYLKQTVEPAARGSVVMPTAEDVERFSHRDAGEPEDEERAA